MAQDTKLVYSDNPGGLPANYVLPPGFDLTVSSVVARISGAAAAGSFYPALSIYSQDGLLMARVRGDTLYAVGDTGVVTWSPFLRQAAAAAPPVASIGEWAWLKDESNTVSVPGNGNFQSIVVDTSGSGGQSNAGKLEAALDSGEGYMRGHAAGIILAQFTIQFATVYAATIIPRFNCTANPVPPGAIGDGSMFPDFTRASSVNILNGFFMTFTDDTDWELHFEVSQNSGAAKTIFASTAKAWLVPVAVAF